MLALPGDYGGTWLCVSCSIGGALSSSLILEYLMVNGCGALILSFICDSYLLHKTSILLFLAGVYWI